MKKITLSFLVPLVVGVNLFAQEGQGVEILDSNWKFMGDFRAAWVDYDYSNPPPGNKNINQGHVDSHGFYFIPKVSLLTPTISGFSGKITGAAITDFGLNSPEYESRNFAFGTNGKPYAILQESYIQYEDSSNRVLLGREEFISPMVGADDYYFLANSFELAHYINKAIENITFHLVYITQMAGVWDSGADGSEFDSMSDTSFVDQKDKDNADNSGMAIASFEYDDQRNRVQIWNYYVSDIYNTLFAQYDYVDKIDTFSYNVGLQFINFKEVGKLAKNNNAQINYSTFSAKVDGSFDNGFDFQTGYTFYGSGQGQGSTLGAWGGYPYFAYGMIFNYFEAGSMRNASVYKAQLGYDLGKVGIKSSWIEYRCTYFNLDEQYSKNLLGQGQSKMVLNGIKATYGKSVGANLAIIYEHRELDNEPNAFGFRFIAGWKF